MSDPKLKGDVHLVRYDRECEQCLGIRLAWQNVSHPFNRWCDCSRCLGIGRRRKRRRQMIDFLFIPRTTLGINLHSPRSRLSADGWQLLTKFVYWGDGLHCTICGGGGMIHAHENWVFDDERGVQLLTHITTLCRLCHGTVHLNQERDKVKVNRLARWYIHLNHCTAEQCREDYRIAKSLYEQRSQRRWAVQASSSVSMLINEVQMIAAATQGPDTSFE